MNYQNCHSFEWKYDPNSQKWDLIDQNFKTNWVKNFDPEKVKLHKIEVSAGDLFYLPAFWFHKVSQTDMTLAVNYWYDVDYLSTTFGLYEMVRKHVES